MNAFSPRSAALDPTRPYWPGSPYGGAANSDPTAGDRHTWDIWHGVMAPYSQYPHYEGRFVSEFGMQSSAALATIATCIEPDERYPQSQSMDHHNKSSDGPRRLAAYLNDTLRVHDTLEDYVYATQFVQAEAMAAAYGGWRRRWQGPGEIRGSRRACMATRRLLAGDQLGNRRLRAATQARLPRDPPRAGFDRAWTGAGWRRDGGLGGERHGHADRRHARNTDIHPGRP